MKMKSVSITALKKYVISIKKSKSKILTLDAFSKIVGIYPDVIAEQLSLFDPMITMNIEYDVKELLPAMEKYIEDEESSKIKVNREVVFKKDLLPYSSVQEFIYGKLTIDGIVDKSASLSDKDLKILKKIINEELKKRKSKK
jgi:NADH/NAD ratio-sensing transcriptional regulator Rex